GRDRPAPCLRRLARGDRRARRRAALGRAQDAEHPALGPPGAAIARPRLSLPWLRRPRLHRRPPPPPLGRRRPHLAREPGAPLPPPPPPRPRGRFRGRVKRPRARLPPPRRRGDPRLPGAAAKPPGPRPPAQRAPPARDRPSYLLPALGRGPD